MTTIISRTGILVIETAKHNSNHHILNQNSDLLAPINSTFSLNVGRNGLEIQVLQLSLKSVLLVAGHCGNKQLCMCTYHLSFAKKNKKLPVVGGYSSSLLLPSSAVIRTPAYSSRKSPFLKLVVVKTPWPVTKQYTHIMLLSTKSSVNSKTKP